MSILQTDEVIKLFDIIYERPLQRARERFPSFSHIVVVNELTTTTGRDITTAIFALLPFS